MSGPSTLSNPPSTDDAEEVDAKAAAKKIRRRRLIKSSIIVFAVILLLGLIGWGVYETQRKSRYQTPAQPSANADGIIAGGKGRTQVDVYVDYQSPASKTFDKVAGPTLDKLVASDAITLIFHPVAHLDQYSTRAAASSGCASDQKEFLAYSHRLFAAQPSQGTAAGLTDDQIVQIAGQAGIINPAFAQCVRSGKYDTWIAHVNAQATKHHVTSTPTVLVKGKSISLPGAAPTLAELNAALHITG